LDGVNEIFPPFLRALRLRIGKRRPVKKAEAGKRKLEAAMAFANPQTTDVDFAAHVETYLAFVKYASIFAAHVLVILALLAYFLT
jgi:hypothetical protein